MNYIDFAGIAGVILAIVALYKAWTAAPKANADAARTWQEMASHAAKVQQEMRRDITQMRNQIDCLQEDLDDYMDGVDKLIKQLEAHDIEPAWRPKRRKK